MYGCYVCIDACALHTWCSWEQGSVFRSLGPELQIAGNYHVGSGNWTQSSGKAASMPNHWTLSLALITSFHVRGDLLCLSHTQMHSFANMQKKNSIMFLNACIYLLLCWSSFLPFTDSFLTSPMLRFTPYSLFSPVHTCAYTSVCVCSCISVCTHMSTHRHTHISHVCLFLHTHIYSFTNTRHMHTVSL